MLFDLAKNLLAQVVVDGRAWPCANLSLSVGGFEDGIQNNKGIGGFLVRGEEAKAMMNSEKDRLPTGEPPTKKRRRERGNIANFFGARDEKRKDFDAARAALKAHRESTKEDDDEDEADEARSELDDELDDESPPAVGREDSSEDLYNNDAPPSAQKPSGTDGIEFQPRKPPALQQKTLDTFFCARCNAHLPSTEKSEHEDFHFAMDLSKEMRREENNPTPTNADRRTPVAQKPTRGRGRPPGSGKDARKGQAKLMFGRPG
jgi:DNA polymerase eta